MHLLWSGTCCSYCGATFGNQQAKKLVSVQEFYDVYRPLLGAFWPDGIWLDGVGDSANGSYTRRGGGGGEAVASPSKYRWRVHRAFCITLVIAHARV